MQTLARDKLALPLHFIGLEEGSRRVDADRADGTLLSARDLLRLRPYDIQTPCAEGCRKCALHEPPPISAAGRGVGYFASSALSTHTFIKTP